MRDAVHHTAHQRNVAVQMPRRVAGDRVKAHAGARIVLIAAPHADHRVAVGKPSLVRLRIARGGKAV